MKICFNMFPPANKLIALIACALLLLSYSRLKADNKKDNLKNIEVAYHKCVLK